MEIPIVYILISVIASSLCQDETVFHCTSNPGCQIALCDPIAVGWDRPGFNIDEHLQDKEYTITCKSNSTVLSWLDFAARNLDITSIRMGLEKLEDKFNGKIESFGKEISDLDEMNEKLVGDNDKIKKAISRIEQKLAVMKKPQLIPKGFGQISKPKPTPHPENCKLKVGNICYFVVIYGEWDVVYKKAFDICNERNADVGLIRDEESYNAIIKYLRKNIPRGEDIWTGIQFDPMTRDVTPADLFTKWYPGDPFTGIEYKDRTNVYLVVNSDPDERSQGMVNGDPTWKQNGVICEILI
uniref:uncharacterized protein LOC120346112 isoform X2 n=1 Tax=Styela clava TaxID=7725 RepID=UPI0019396F74|nr:uncharacterized protein LOC120346112 isoform X2 [Styela clava]